MKRQPELPFTRPDNKAFARSANTFTDEQDGMTVREYFAARAMQGLAFADDHWDEGSAIVIAEQAVRIADALIKELQKKR